MRRHRAAGLLLVLVAAFALLAAGCGGGGGNGAQEWADGVCSELDQWVTKIQDAAAGVAAQGLNVDRAQLRRAVDEAGGATADLAEGLRGLGRPESEPIDTAVQELDRLGQRLDRQVDQIRAAVEGDAAVVAILGTVSDAISEATRDVQATFQRIGALDPGGLGEAFQQSDTCEALRQRDLP